MNNNKFLITMGLIILVAIAGVWYGKSHQLFSNNQGGAGVHDEHSDDKSMDSMESMDSKNQKKQIAKYICPMHPQITSDKPGSCSICGMDLVQVTELEDKDEPEDKTEEQGHDTHALPTDGEGWESLSSKPKMNKKPSDRATVKLSLKKEQMIGVMVVSSKKRNLFKSISAPGRIAFDPELYTAQSEYLEALKQWKRIQNSPIADVRESTRQMISSAKIRLRVLGLSDDQINRLRKTGRQSEGLLVSGKGEENWVYADVFEMDLPYIEKGHAAVISANFLQGKTIPGKVISVDQVINPDTRTAKVRIQLLSGSDAIRPESYVSVKILAPLGVHVSVPLEAVMDTGKETFVFVKQAKGRYEPRNVRISMETNEFAAISEGLIAGEEVVFGANFMIDSESRLRSVITGSSSSASGHKH